MLEAGTPAPEFSVQDHHGNTVSLKDFSGKKVILWFYPKADTPGCTMEGQGFRDEYPAYQEKNAVVLGVSLDTVEENRAFAEKYNFPYPLLCDVNRDIALAYQAVNSKEDQNASRITYVIGSDGTIQEAIGQVECKTHAADLKSRL